MKQAELWLPGFEFADALLGTEPLPSAAISETASTSATFALIEPAQELPAIDASLGDDSITTTASLLPNAPTSILAMAASAQEVAFTEPPWPQLTQETHADLKGQVTKFDANVEAISLLRQLEAAEAVPSVEQRKTLNRYTGWGGDQTPL